MHQDMISVAAGKILLAKTNWFFHPKIQLFQNVPLHSLRSTCHSTCPLSQRILLSKRTSRLYESRLSSHVGGDLRQQDEFADFGALAQWKTRFFMKFRHLTRATGAPMQTLPWFKLFLYPMDRAEVLHAQSYNISDRRKNTPGKNDRVNS